MTLPRDPANIDGRHCEHVDPEDFFPQPEDMSGIETAKRVCVGCPALTVCLEFAMYHETGLSHAARSGVFGGMSAQGQGAPPHPTGQRRQPAQTAHRHHRHQRMRNVRRHRPPAQAVQGVLGRVAVLLQEMPLRVRAVPDTARHEELRMVQCRVREERAARESVDRSQILLQRLRPQRPMVTGNSMSANGYVLVVVAPARLLRSNDGTRRQVRPRTASPSPGAHKPHGLRSPHACPGSTSPATSPPPSTSTPDQERTGTPQLGAHRQSVPRRDWSSTRSTAGPTCSPTTATAG